MLLTNELQNDSVTMILIFPQKKNDIDFYLSNHEYWDMIDDSIELVIRVMIIIN